MSIDKNVFIITTLKKIQQDEQIEKMIMKFFTGRI